MDVSVDVSYEAAFRFMRTVRGRAYRLKKAMQHIAEFVIENSERRWGTDPSTGAGWAPLAPSTIRRKGHSRILHETGALRGSLDYQFTAKQASVFSTVPYGDLHMTGYSKVPARPFIGVNPADELEIQEIMEDFLEGR